MDGVSYPVSAFIERSLRELRPIGATLGASHLGVAPSTGLGTHGSGNRRGRYPGALVSASDSSVHDRSTQELQRVVGDPPAAAILATDRLAIASCRDYKGKCACGRRGDRRQRSVCSAPVSRAFASASPGRASSRLPLQRRANLDRGRSSLEVRVGRYPGQVGGKKPRCRWRRSAWRSAWHSPRTYGLSGSWLNRPRDREMGSGNCQTPSLANLRRS